MSYPWRRASRISRQPSQKGALKCCPDKNGKIRKDNTNGQKPKNAHPRVFEGVNDLATLFPEIAKEAYGWGHSTVTSRSQKKLPWKCPEEGHIYEMPIAQRTRFTKGSEGSGCIYCHGKAVLARFNDLATLHPEVAKDAYGWDPTTVRAHHNQKRIWKCPEGHIYEA